MPAASSSIGLFLLFLIIMFYHNSRGVIAVRMWNAVGIGGGQGRG